MTTGADGMLYAGTKNGIVAISPNGVVTERMLPGEHIDAIAIDADSHLWAGTRGKGLRYFNDSATQTGYDKKDRRPIVSHVAQALLAKYGSLLKSRSGSVRLTRV